MTAGALLQVNGVSLQFGGVRALSDVSFAVGPREICGIIGPNGAGKTTLFNCLSRIYQVDSGSIHFAGQDMTPALPHEVARAGIARTFQNVALFDRQTVRQNILAGSFHALGPMQIGALLGTAGYRRAHKEAADSLDRLLAMTRLEEVADTLVSELPFGTRKRVELARALAMKPKLLLLDEPAAGLNHEEVAELEQWIVKIRDDLNISVLLIEHHMNLVMRVSDHVVVLEFGNKIADGLPAEVANDENVIRAYLGAPA